MREENAKILFSKLEQLRTRITETHLTNHIIGNLRATNQIEDLADAEKQLASFKSWYGRVVTDNIKGLQKYHAMLRGCIICSRLKDLDSSLTKAKAAQASSCPGDSAPDPMKLLDIIEDEVRKLENYYSQELLFDSYIKEFENKESEWEIRALFDKLGLDFGGTVKAKFICRLEINKSIRKRQ
ncbi:hypothetical protein BJ508DRAFT_315140 [Ascobolus immersus RN42]|uniref:Uncharacterized protein n=1 Tax=Ascobolus immersus RN42 TaxID=1160509 RepID=A0A3N4HC50_ASCIM|nr:hypothetical protein BJ508DRAFT_315140 [Ascobolus immersus RN42]